MTFSVAHWDTGDGTFVFSLKGEEIIEHTSSKCHMITN